MLKDYIVKLLFLIQLCKKDETTILDVIMHNYTHTHIFILGHNAKCNYHNG